MYKNVKQIPMGAAAGWTKIGDGPVIGPEYGTTFDMQVLREEDRYRMWFSWRPVRLIAHSYSYDGLKWEMPRAVLTAVAGSDWEGDEVNRPTVLRKDGLYHMWYSGQVFAKENQVARTCIGYATSKDGIEWKRAARPVLLPELPWEKYCVFCPHVLWDEQTRRYRMWYSGGRMQEADAIGYAESSDGVHWTKFSENPVFSPDPEIFWEMSKVEACFVLRRDTYNYMFYLGMCGDGRALVGLARSENGITGWVRHPDNPILAGDDGTWDFAGICKVSVLEQEGDYLLWYNGCNHHGEQIGCARHAGLNLFPKDMERYTPERGHLAYKGAYNYYYNRYNMLQEMRE